MPRSTDISPLSVLLSRVDAMADGAPARDTIATEFPSVDKMLGGGLRRGDLVVLGGDVGSGKSALALAIALRAAARSQVLLLSGEMTPERIHERALAIEGRARIDDLRRGSLGELGRAAVGAAAVRLRDGLPAIDILPDGGIAGLREQIEAAGDLDLVVVDSLQSFAGGARTMAEETAAAVAELKDLALHQRVAILTTAQLPGLERRPDRRPIQDDFGALGAVKFHADVVCAIYREEMYDDAPDVMGATEFLVLKNRHGAIGYTDLYFYAQWLRFEDLLDPDR